MGDLEKILALAREQIGVTEQPPGSNSVLYNTDYYGGAVQGANFPWCCVFIWWLFWKTDLSTLFCGGQKTAYCPFVVNYAREHGQWVKDGYKPGDLFLFDWDGDGQADHIGICESVSGMSATTIEGNVSEGVRRMTRSLLNVKGAFRPGYEEGKDPSAAPQDDKAYGEETEKDPSAAQPREQGTASLGTPRGEYAGRQDDRMYTVQSGDTLWGIAEKFYGNGWAYPLIISANNLTDSTIYPGQLLKLARAGENTPETETRKVTLMLNKSVWEALEGRAARKGVSLASLLEEIING